MNPIEPTDIRYIKLGAGGKWVKQSLEQGLLPFGYVDVPDEPCRQGHWEAVHQSFVDSGRRPGKAKDAVREIRGFYELGPECLWITFADGHLWWTYAEPIVIWQGKGDPEQAPRIRNTIGGWRNTDIDGEPLTIDNLSTRLTQVAAYRQTICRVKESDYLLRRINGTEEPVVARARAARAQAVAVALAMIEGLHWADFETLVDLIFSRSGWQRVSRLGGTQADTDLVLELPTTGETAFVQVKSKAGQGVLNDYIGRFSASAHHRMFFICHSPAGTLHHDGDPNVHIWAGDHLADAAIKAGLFDWLTERSG
ncbi:MAG: hypothetical protein ACI9JL_004523 [Paracoccaceae bacterium]|jgi:hypothetical protein